jgi:hypothetical protein
MAIRYLDARRPDAVILRSSMRAEFPFAGAWFDHGIPQGRGELLGTFDLDHDEERVFRWHPEGDAVAVEVRDAHTIGTK